MDIKDVTIMHDSEYWQQVSSMGKAPLTLELRPNVWEEGNQKFRIQGKGNSTYKSSEMRKSSVCSRRRKNAIGLGVWRARRRVIEMTWER